MGVAQRYNKVLVHHTLGIPSMAKYDMQFPGWSMGSDPANSVSNMLFDAMKKIDYTPPLHFHLYPAPGPMTKSPDGKNPMAVTIFEEHPPFTNNPVAAAFVKTFNERAPFH